MSGAKHKHPCPDCRSCQWCGDDRCRLCRRGPSCTGRKLSLTEQIRLYEELNSSARRPAAQSERRQE